jgi:signal transduction histidine kinase
MRHTIAIQLGILLLCTSAACPAVFFEPQVAEHFVPDKELSYRVEPDQALSAGSVIAQQDGWTSRATQPFHSGGRAMVVWARFALPVTDLARRTLIDASPWETVDYYIVSDGKVVDTKHAGTLLPRSARSAPIPMIAPFTQSGFVAIDIPAQAHYVVFARLASATRFVRAPGLRFSLWNPNEVQLDERNDRVIQAIFFGMLLFMFMFNFALYLFNPRERSFLYYALSLIGVFGTWAPMTGITFEFLWPEHPQWDYFCMWISMPVAQSAFIQFMRNYLDTRKYFRKIDTYLKWLMAGALLVILIPLAPLAVGESLVADTAIAFSGLFAFLALPAFVFLSIRATVMRLPSARVLLAAGAAGFLGPMVPPLIQWGLVPSGSWAWNGPQIGTALMGIILTIGLGLRLQHATAELAVRKLEEERLRNAHELEKRNMLERERSRIMSDMHDGVGGQLISVLSLLEQGDISSAEVAKAIRECLDDLRLTIDSLEPTDNDLLPVLGNLRYRLDQRLQKHGINLNWTVTDLPKLACLTPRNILHILRILQEAFTNVLRHAHATAVGVETGVDASGEHVFISIRDNGRGFSGDHQGHGLASMRQRAAIIGGALDILPSATGTTLKLILPVA